jgi:hypothetical protein
MGSRPAMHPLQQLGQRVVEITTIEDIPGNQKEKVVSYTWNWRFENIISELAELFKDQPERKDTFQYDHGAWELKPRQRFIAKTKTPPESGISQKS